eukprot:12398691-Karenia_brevis.AAC.2
MHHGVCREKGSAHVVHACIVPVHQSGCCGVSVSVSLSHLALATMVKHLTVKDFDVIDGVCREKGSVSDALVKVNKARKARKMPPVQRDAVYRYVAGVTHRRDAEEKRGRPQSLSESDIDYLMEVRKGLVQEADSEYRVTYADVIEEAGYDHVCQKVVEEGLRGRGVRFTAPRKKIALSSKDATARKKVAKQWVKKPASFWLKKVHAYKDEKAFPIPLTPAQRSKFRQTRITGHLRLPNEGTEKGFTKPRTSHSWLGIPSVTISAAIANDRVIMWQEVKRWNGAAAAEVYKGPLLKALQKTHGTRRRYVVIEDGDRKGNQSKKGLCAKADAGIDAMTLPPRSPCWMPLDYAVWAKIMDKMDEHAPDGIESKADFVERLRKTALSLPRGFIKGQIMRMKTQIQGVIDAK